MLMFVCLQVILPTQNETRNEIVHPNRQKPGLAQEMKTFGLQLAHCL
jgi:hypothetical protein